MRSRQLSLEEMYGRGLDGGEDRENDAENEVVEGGWILSHDHPQGVRARGAGHREGVESGEEDRPRDGRAVPSTSYASLDPQRRGSRSLASAILDRAVYSRFCPWSERLLRSKQMAMYAGSSCRTPLRLCGSLGLRRSTLAAEVDGIGELVVVGCKGGHVLVNDVQRILEVAAEAQQAAAEASEGVALGRGEKVVEPGLHVRVGDGDGDAAVNAVRWNPDNQNEIAVLTNKSVSMYDINRTRGESSRRMPLQQSKAMDAVYFPSSSSTGSGQYCVAVACDRQGVLLFDARSNRNTVGGKPVCVLKGDTPRHTGARCVSVVDHGRIVLAGGGRDLDGYMNVWDLRNVSGNVALTFSAAPNKHQHLRRVCLKTQLGRVEGLVDESQFIPCTYPEFFLPDPASYHRVGINMRCGWSAVLDLGRLELSHVHAPPARHGPCETWMDAMQVMMDDVILARRAGNAGHVALPHETIDEFVASIEPSTGSPRVNRSAPNKNIVGGCWLGESFVVPSATMDRTVHIVDFSGPARADGSVVDQGVGEVDAPSAVRVGVSHDAVGVVRVPGDRGAIAGGAPALLSYGTDGTWNVILRE